MIQHDKLPFRTLLQISTGNGARGTSECRLLLELLGAADALRQSLQREFVDLRLGEIDFEVLVCLLATDPAPITPAMLAGHTGAARSSITESVDRLETRGFVRRERDQADGRSVAVHLTPAGAAVAHDCVARFVKTAGLLCGAIAPDAMQSVSKVCFQTSLAAAAQASVRSPEASRT